MSVFLTFVCVIICVQYIMGFPTPTLDGKELWPDQYGINTPQQSTVNSPKYRKRPDNMYLLPRSLKHGDKISIEGTFENNINNFSIILGTDIETDRVFEFHADFVTDIVTMKIVQDGEEQSITDNRTTNDSFKTSTFNMSFEAIEGNYNHALDIVIGQSSFKIIDLSHNIEDISHILIEGDKRKEMLAEDHLCLLLLTLLSMYKR